MFKKLAVALAIAAGLALAVPAAANADEYTQGTPCASDVSVLQAGGTATITCFSGTWAPGEAVDWVGTGEDGAGIHMVSLKTATSSVHFLKHANADGGDLLKVTLPADAVGTYTIVGTGETTSHVCAITLTVLPVDRAAVYDPGQGLADTGAVIATWAAWAGGGLVLLGLIALAIVTWARRVRAS